MDQSQVKGLLAQDMVHGIIDRMLLTHYPVLDDLVGKTWEMHDHQFTIDRTQSIYAIKCEGRVEFSIQFDIIYRCNYSISVSTDTWPAVDTIVVNWNAIATTLDHLQLIIAFISHLIANVPTTKE